MSSRAGKPESRGAGKQESRLSGCGYWAQSFSNPKKEKTSRLAGRVIAGAGVGASVGSN